MIDPRAVRVLIQLGSTFDANLKHTDDVLDLLRPYEDINRMPTSAWKEISINLSDLELVSLIKGLTITERELHWAGGSVAAVIWLFRGLESRIERPSYEELAGWVMKNTSNQYLPFGTSNHGANSFSEYQKRVDRHQSFLEAGRRERKEAEEEAERQRKVRTAKRRKSALDRSTDIRVQLIRKINQISVEEQLTFIADDDVYSVNFYPTRCAGNATSEIISSLHNDVINSLALKLKGKQKGPWGSFKKRLLRIREERLKG